MALDAAEDELELAGEASGIDFVEQGEEFVVGPDFAGIEREGAELEPTGGRRNGLQAVFFGELLDETVEAGAIVAAHVHELHSHAVTGAAVANDGAEADFAAGDVEQHFHVSAGGKGMGYEKKHAAHAEFFGVGDVALTGALPANEKVFGRTVTRGAAALVFWNFDRAIPFNQHRMGGVEREEAVPYDLLTKRRQERGKIGRSGRGHGGDNRLGMRGVQRA